MDGSPTAFAAEYGSVAVQFFFVGKWAGMEESCERAVGQVFARALLCVMWGDRYQQMPRTELESNYRKLLTGDVSDVETTAQKDALTLGMYSLLEHDEELREQVMLFQLRSAGRSEG